MAGLKKARRVAAAKAAANKLTARQPPVQTYQNRVMTPQAEKVQPANPWVMTTAADSASGNTER